MSTQTPHRLTGKDLTGRTAVCSVDGPVGIRSRGNGRWECAVKRAAKTRAYKAGHPERVREQRRRWAERHPEKARAGRAARSPHRLTSFDEPTMTGGCPVCGTVGAVVKGRRRKDGRPGVMCANRARELYPNATSETPQEFCRICRRAYLTADGACPRCDDREQTDWAHALRVSEHRDRDDERILSSLLDADEFELVSTRVDADDDPAAMPRSESSVYGWRVLGAGDPNAWWAANAHLVESDNN